MDTKGRQMTTGNGVPKPKKVFVAPAITNRSSQLIKMAVRRNHERANFDQARVDKARAEIAAGTFETEKRIDGTVNKITVLLAQEEGEWT